MGISSLNAKKIYIATCYLMPIISTFYKKHNLNQNCPFKGLQHNINTLKNEGNIIFLGEFNARKTTN